MSEDYIEDIDFPPVELTNEEKKNIRPNPSKTSKYILLGGIGFIILGLIIFLIAYFSKKKSSHDGGDLFLTYQLNSNGDITIFNPTDELKNKDYSIEIINNSKRLRSLENNVEINDNKLKSEIDGEIELKIKFKKKLTSISSMFKDCGNLININLNKLKTDKIKNMDYTFLNCIHLKNANFSLFNSEKIETMDNAFGNCKNLVSLNLSSFKTNNLKSMKSMFKNCINIFIIDLSEFKINDKIDISEALDNTNNLQILILNEVSKNILDPNHLYDKKECKKGEGELCKECSNENSGLFKCSECNGGYFLPKEILYPTKCNKCSIENCLICNDNYLCNKCESGYEIFNEGKKCISIIVISIPSIPEITIISDEILNATSTTLTTIIPETIINSRFLIQTLITNIPTTIVTTIPEDITTTIPTTIITTIPTTIATTIPTNSNIIIPTNITTSIS